MRVQWDGGITNSYRMGKDGKFDLQFASDLNQPMDKSNLNYFLFFC